MPVATPDAWPLVASALVGGGVFTLGSVLLRSRGDTEVDGQGWRYDTARAVGRLCGLSRHADVVDVHVALHARLHDHVVVTSDADDLRQVDPTIPLITV